jgi:GPH family glycoside/pentoside/hexuronide:cation symporter
LPNEKPSISLAKKSLWGIGGFAENLANNAFITLSYPIFSIGMGISPFYVGLATSLSRVIDAIIDPIMGNITDNTKTRWGRRRPWIFIGAILMSITFAAIWWTTKMEKGFTADPHTTGLWHFDSIESGNVKDSGIWQNHGLTSSSTLEYAGKFKKALRFPGDGRVIQIGTPFSGIQNDFTLEMYVKSDLYNPGDVLFSHESSSSQVCLYFPDKKILAFQIHGTDAQNYVLVSKDSLTTGSWNHIAAVCDSHQMQLYVNGKLKAEEEIPADINWGGTGVMTRIGASAGTENPAPGYAGLIDELRISDTARYEENFSLVKSSTWIYLIIIVSLSFIAFTIWVIPYSGLGLEMAVDYSERTQLMIFRVVPSFIVGIAIGSLYKITLMDKIWKGNEVMGAFWVGCIIAVLMLIMGIIPALFCKERYADTKQPKINLFEAFAQTLKDKPFLLLIGSVFFVFVALFFMIPLLTYISLYYVCDGSKQLMGTVGMYTSFVQAGTQILSMFAIGYFSKRYDKKKILIGGLIIGIIGYLSSWFLFTPKSPFMTILPPVIINIGLCACWVLNGSFNADICDYDQLKTGRRREGMFSAVFGFLNKLAIALVTTVSSWVLVKLGFEGEGLNPTAQQLFTLRWTYVVIPVVAMIGAIFCMWWYPLTREKVEEIQAKLKKKA